MRGALNTQHEEGVSFCCVQNKWIVYGMLRTSSGRLDGDVGRVIRVYSVAVFCYEWEATAQWPARMHDQTGRSTASVALL